MSGFGFPAPRRGGSKGRIRRVTGCSLATALLVLGTPSPSSAAPNPSVTISDVTVTEGTGSAVNANFTIRSSPRPGACCALQVNWATAPGSATAPADFTSSSGTVSLTKTAFSRVVTVPVAGDASDEPNETFVVNLTNLVGSPGAIGDAQGIATITDDDQPPTLSVNDVSVTEGDTGPATATFTTSLSVVSANAVTFNWTTTAAGSATQGVDYVAASGSRTIAAGTTGVTIDVTVNGDVLDEADETFGITLSSPGNATISDGAGVATITDDDPLPVLSIDDVSVTEGNAGTTTATFTATLAPSSAKTVTVTWITSDDSATQPPDYVGASASLTFLPGDTSETLNVTVNGDITAELDETFKVTLSSPVNATLGDAQGIGTIVDDEIMPVIDVDDPSVPEGASGPTSLSFTVSLSNPAAIPVTVDWATAAGTAANPTDYADENGTVTFAPFETSETVDVTVNGDGTYEQDETVMVDLSNPTNAPIGDIQGTGIITDDDAAPTLSVEDASIVEGNAGVSVLTLAVSLTGDTELDATVDFATADSTAAGGSDYAPASGTITIVAGETAGTVDVPVNGDLTYESNERFLLTLSAPAGATVGDGSAIGTITNDDKARTSITLSVVKKPLSVKAKGLLESTKAGHRVTVTFFKKYNGRFVKIASKTVNVKVIKDRDGDSLKDGIYLAALSRPKAQGTYKFVARFKGTPTHKPCSRSRIFTLSPR